VFFFEKKNQKTFAAWARRCNRLRAQCAKVFCFFSSEKFVTGVAPTPFYETVGIAVAALWWGVVGGEVGSSMVLVSPQKSWTQGP
jgi:hypothetical protein